MKTILVLLLLCSVASAITLNYGECQNFTLDTNATIEVCAPAYPSHVDLNLGYGEMQSANNVTASCAPWVDLNITECPVCPPPSHVDLNLGWGQNASANNVTSTCEAWRDTNLTICPPPTSPPPLVNLSLAWGQTATQNNFTATCQPWYDTNITTCPTCDILPQVSYNLTYSEVKTFNNFTASCAPWVDLNITEPQIVYEGCPQLNKTIELYPTNTYTNFTYGLVVTCLQSLAQPTVVYVPQLLAPQTVSLNCNATEARVMNDRNLTLSITQCPVCSVCNLMRPDDQILDCNIKASFCYSDLQDLVNLDAFRNGTARQMFNQSKNLLLAQVSTATNGTILAQTDLTAMTIDRDLWKDNYNILKASNDDNNKLLIAVCVILAVVILVTYLKAQDVKKAVSPKDIPR